LRDGISLARRESIARTTVGAREDQQHPPTAKIREAKIAATMEPWQSEIRRGCASFKSIAFDFALRQRTVAESVRWIVLLAEVQFGEMFFERIKSQQQSTILVEQLPAEPAPNENYSPSQGKSENHIAKEHLFPLS